MRGLMRFFLLLLSCLIVTGCAFWNPFEEKTPLQSTTTKSPFSGPEATFLTLSAGSAQNVVLLVPLTGSLANAGQAVRDGYLTAYQNDKSDEKPAHVSVIDTNQTSVQEAYQKAKQDGADFIIGPLAKNDLQTLVQSNSISALTLALNYLESSQTPPNNLYQFGLSPLDEARQAAALAWQKGLYHAVIIAPRSIWGNTVAQAFQNEWQALGGDVVMQLQYSGANQTLNENIRNLISKYRHRFDVVFLAADPATARQIKPLFKFYDAGDIPFYATALIYTGAPNPTFDRDLNGVTFCDAPWILADSSAAAQLRQQISVFWPVNFQQNGRLYALGVDAYQLTKKLFTLTSPEQTLDGTTGILALDNQHRIVRQLTCARFERGKPEIIEQALPPVITDEQALETATADAENDNR